MKKASKVIRQHPGCHLHGSLPGTPWSPWQRTNLAKCDEAGRERIRRAREQSLEWDATFRRLAKCAIAKGGSVSFEWPRHCEGWEQPLIMDMLRELGLQPVAADGCATGLLDANGSPLFKLWTIAVSSASLVEQLQVFRCDKSYEHGKTASSETAKTAYYPRALCMRGHPPRSGCS